MDSIWLGLGKLFVSLEGLDPKTDQYHVLVFVIGCAIAGFLILILDLCYFQVTGGSFLKLRHDKLGTVAATLVTWPIASGLWGFIALVAHILQPSVLGCATAGLTWTVSVSAYAQTQRDQQAPAQRQARRDEKDEAEADERGEEG